MAPSSIYTDGVIEARTGRELFGIERLDAVLAARRRSAPQAIAEAVLEACRAYSGGNLTDDCAVVVISVEPAPRVNCRQRRRS